MKTKLVAAVAASGVAALAGTAGAQSPYTIPTCATGQHNATTAPYYCIPDAKPPRGTARGLTLVVVPNKDRRAPIKFKGRGVLHRGPVAKSACRGRVKFTLRKPGGKVVAKKFVKLSSQCKYNTRKVTVKSSKLNRKGKLKARAIFLGNSQLKQKKSKVRTVKYRL